MSATDILKKTEDFVSNLFSEKLSPLFTYHNLSHTANVVENTQKLGKKAEISEEDLEIALIAAWFHDTGYTISYSSHEEKGKEIAKNFLSGHNYDPLKIEKVLNCIDATIMPQNPKTPAEEVLCDADLNHFGREDFFEYSDLLRNEWENLDIQKSDDAQWLKTSIDLLSTHRFFTSYARKKFTPVQSTNLMRAQKQYKKVLKQAEEEKARFEKLEFDKQKLETEKQKISSRKVEEKLEVEKEKIALKKESAKIAERGIETMFRNTVRTHVEFSAMADSKANIMITVNTLIISLVLTNLFSRMQEDTQFYLLLPTIMLLIVCLTCIIFGILVTKPKISAGVFSQDDIKARKTNLLFFGNFFNMPLNDFEWGMDEMMHDKNYLYSSMVKDFYFLGQAVGRKYKNLRICYNIFMYGLVISVLAYIIVLLLKFTGTPVD